MKKVTIFNKEDSFMKKICNYSLSILAGCALLAACAKENINNDSMKDTDKRDENVPAGTTLIKVILPDAFAKVSLTQDTGNANGHVRLAWESTDQIQVIDAANASNCATFTIQEGYTAHEATFSGDAVSAGSYNILYGANNVAAADAMEYAFQTQSGNASTAHLHYVALLEGVDSYEEVLFTDEWAAEHGGTLKQSGVLRLRIRLPEAVTSVSECTLRASESIFYTSNAGTTTTDRLTLSFDNNAAVGSDHVLAAYAVLPWKDVAIADGTVFEITVKTTDQDFYRRYFTPGATSLVCGAVNAFKVDEQTEAFTLDDFAGGDGSQASPYLIANARQLCNVASVYSGSTHNVTYFALCDNIDMASVTEWRSIGNSLDGYDNVIDFDGRGKFVSNFNNTTTGNYMGSFFGILHGTLKNITFNDISIDNSTNCVGGIACWVGASNDITWGIMENVHINGGSVSQTAAQQVGGLAGKARNATFTDCSVSDVTITSTTTDASGSANQGYGGIAGWSYNSSYTRCSFDGSLTSARLAGGIVGYGNVGTVITDCTSAGSITAEMQNGRNGEVAGGIVGWMTNTTLSGCSSTASVSGSNNCIGGIVGQIGASGATIKLCHFTGSLSGAASVGGIIGYCEQAATVEECWANSTFSASTGNTGGIVGSTNTNKAVIIRNCYSTGRVYGNGQCIGGILGEMGATASVQNCYSIARIDGQRVMGGIVGRAANMKWDVNVASGNTISGCIAWNPSIICTDRRDATLAGGSGTIVGFTSVKNILTDGRRKADINFQPSDSDYDGTGVDQPDCNGTNWVHGTTPGTGKTYQCPYHGTAATSGATVSLLAQALGWSSDVWDFTGNLPSLKNNPQ